MEKTVQSLVVVFADLADFSKLVNEDEANTIKFMRNCLNFVQNECSEHNGDLVKKTGDGFLLLMESAAKAVQFSIDFHRFVESNQKGHHKEFSFRIGLHFGEVHRDQNDAYGHTVNIAARLESIAGRGTTLISYDVYRRSKGLVECDFESCGVPVLKNIRDQISTFRIIDRAEDHENNVRETALRASIFSGLTLFGTEGRIAVPTDGPYHVIIGSLLLSKDLSLTKARLSALLWPEEKPQSAINTLEQSVDSVHAVLRNKNADVLLDTIETLSFDQRLISLDIKDTLDDVGKGVIADVVVDGLDWDHQILPSLDQRNDLLRTWASVARSRWRQKFIRALEQAFSLFEDHEIGAWRTSMALLAIEPGHEPASQVLISHYLAKGNRAAALGEYHRLSNYLEQEFGLKPSTEVEELIDKASKPKNGTSGFVGRFSENGYSRLRIVVGSFEENQAPDSHSLFGFRSELVANLSRFREWTVFDGDRITSTQDIVNSDEDAACYALFGTPKLSNGIAAIALRLIEHGSDRVVWAETFNMSLADWQGTQRRTVARIAATLEIYLSADRLTSNCSSGFVRNQCFDNWMRGELLLSRWTVAAEEEATAIFKSIILEEPKFAPAYASLASVYNVRHVICPRTERDTSNDIVALNLGRTAVELDPMDARNHLAVAWTTALAGYYDQALIHLDLAVQLNRNSPKTIISAAMGYAFFGDSRRSVKLLEETLAIAPIIPDYLWSYVSSCLYLAGDYQTSLEAISKAGNAINDNAGWKSIVLMKLGREDEARASFAKLQRRISDDWADSSPADAVNICKWFTSLYPIKRAEHRKLIYDAIRSAAGISQLTD